MWRYSCPRVPMTNVKIRQGERETRISFSVDVGPRQQGQMSPRAVLGRATLREIIRAMCPLYIFLLFVHCLSALPLQANHHSGNIDAGIQLVGAELC